MGLCIIESSDSRVCALFRTQDHGTMLRTELPFSIKQQHCEWRWTKANENITVSHRFQLAFSLIQHLLGCWKLLKFWKHWHWQKKSFFLKFSNFPWMYLCLELVFPHFNWKSCQIFIFLAYLKLHRKKIFWTLFW